MTDNKKILTFCPCDSYGGDKACEQRTSLRLWQLENFSGGIRIVKRGQHTPELAVGHCYCCTINFYASVINPSKLLVCIRCSCRADCRRPFSCTSMTQ